MTATLESIAQSLNYAELPETWWVPDISEFSENKKLYDYQRSAMENAACALFQYYGNKYDWEEGEPKDRNDWRKRRFKRLYLSQFSDIPKYENRSNKEFGKQNEVFRILAEYMDPEEDSIRYHHLINRMCFWMATGSGKTLVMIKLIEYLHFLQSHKEIPNHPMLILAPSEHLLKQIRQTVDEFNRSRDLTINLIALRDRHREHQGQLGNTVTVYYHRSDNISDVQKEALTDYRTYQNDGKWFILLDEAHKGTKEDSKRQSYYAVMARAGFLFNFSATFTDKEDIATTVKKYNLEEFIKNGHGKNIYLNKSEYSAFINKKEEISLDERKKIVLKSLITLAYVSERVHELRRITNLGEDLYHLPLMLTLVNSVNTDIERERNDLWTFFETLQDIATGEIDGRVFEDAKEALISDWQNAELLFGGDGKAIVRNSEETIQKMTVPKLRKMVFLGSRKGALQYVRSKDSKELAFQMKNADFPFALIRIGDTSKWRNKFLANYEETTTLQETSFFGDLEKKPITILMGSRSFFESWDSNRPNIINFINIGGIDARKFVVQSVGRGVRIQPLPQKRKRLEKLLPDLENGIKEILVKHRDQVLPIETLFLFATNRQAIKTVLEGLETEKELSFEPLEGFELERRPKISTTDADMPLLIPEYREVARSVDKLPKFRMSEETLNRIRGWFHRTSDSVLIVRDKLMMPKIKKLRTVIDQATDVIEPNQEKHYDQLSFLQSRLLSYIDEKVQEAHGIREIIEEPDENVDIVHFRNICVQREHLDIGTLQEKMDYVKAGKTSNEELSALFNKFEKGLISREELKAKIAGEKEIKYKGLKIKKISNHYYFPIVLGKEQPNYIKHIIKEQSEIIFLNKLEEWAEQNNNDSWDAWMFSKIDDSLDKIYIPYFSESNHHSRFFPDFIFWMCRGNKYQIVFVDPKGMAYTTADHKIDGYTELFGTAKDPKSFTYRRKWEVSTKLLMFNPDGTPSLRYKPYWTKEIDKIFEG